MGEQSNYGNTGGNQQISTAASPKQGHSKKAQTNGQIKIHEARVEGPAVSDHGDGRDEKPWRPAMGRAYESKCSPEEDQHGNDDQNAFGRDKTDYLSKFLQRQIDEDVVPSRLDVQPRRLALIYQMCQPGIVGVTADIACLNPFVPETGDQ